MSMADEWLDINYNFPGIKGIKRAGYTCFFDNFTYEQRQIIANDFARGEWIRARVWFRVESMHVLTPAKGIRRQYTWPEIKHLCEKPTCLKIEFKRFEDRGFVINGSSYEFLDRPGGFDRVRDWQHSPCFTFVWRVVESLLSLRACALELDFLDRQSHVDCLNWAIARMLEHPTWFDLPIIHLKEGQSPQLLDRGDWPCFQRLFTMPLEDWRARGHAWPLGDPSGNLATKRLDLLKYNEMTKTKKQKKGSLL